MIAVVNYFPILPEDLYHESESKISRILFEPNKQLTTIPGSLKFEDFLTFPMVATLCRKQECVIKDYRFYNSYGCE